MCGKGAKGDNNAVVDEQRRQAAEQEAKEAARQERLKTGLASVKQAFEGSPVMGTKAYDWSTFKAPQTMPAAMATYIAGTPGAVAPDFSKTGSVPAGYTAVQVPARTTGAKAGAAAAATTGAATTGSAATGNDLYSLKSPTGLPMSRGGMIDPNAGYSPGDADYNKYSTSSISASSGGGRNQYASDTVPINNGSGGSGSGSGATGGGTEWALKDANGKIYYQGDALDTQYDTGETTGGFDDAFYNKYKQSVLDYYMPQVSDQYKKAQEQATYGLGRSGNLRSSAANTLVADLAKQNALNETAVRSQADTAAGDLRSQVSTEEQKAISQLYATEDPEIASNQALASVRDISLKQPDLSPLSAVFNLATIGGANIAKGYQDQQNLNTFTGAIPKDSSRNVRS
jgi:hypothetical protein